MCSKRTGNTSLTGVMGRELTYGWHWRTPQPARCRYTLSLVQPVTERGRRHQHIPEDSRHILVSPGARPESTLEVQGSSAPLLWTFAGWLVDDGDSQRALSTPPTFSH